MMPHIAQTTPPTYNAHIMAPIGQIAQPQSAMANGILNSDNEIPNIGCFYS
jgi:hypothetical protein